MRKVLLFLGLTLSTFSLANTDYFCEQSQEQINLIETILNTDSSCTDIARDHCSGIFDSWEKVYCGADVEKACEECREDRSACQEKLKELKDSAQEICL